VTAFKICPDSAPAPPKSADTQGVYNTSLSGLAISLCSIYVCWLWAYMYVYYVLYCINFTLSHDQLCSITLSFFIPTGSPPVGAIVGAIIAVVVVLCGITIGIITWR